MLSLALSLSLAASPLHLWHAYRGEEEAALQEAVNRFTSQTGTSVELLALPYDAYASKLTSAIPHGAGPDVFIFAHERLRQFVDASLVAPSNAGGDDTYLPQALEALTLDGKTYGHPLALKSLALYVNTALVHEAPTDTDAIAQVAQSLRREKPGVYALAYEAGDFYFHAPWLFGFGGTLFDDAGRAQFDTPAMAAACAYVKGLLDSGTLPDEASGALIKSLFNDGRAAMAISGPWFAGEISPRVAYSVVPLPRVSTTGLPARPFLGVEAAFVSSRAQSGADALAHHLATGESAIIRALKGRQVPAEAAAYLDARVANDGLLRAFGEAAREALPMPHTLEMARVWEPMKLALRAVLQGGALPEQAGALAERRYRALFREAPKETSPWPWVLGALAVGAFGLARAWSRRGPQEKQPDTRLGLSMVAPATLGFLLLVAGPLLWGMGLSLFHHESGRYTFVGVANFVDIVASRGFRITEPLSFYFTLFVTLLWTAVNVVLHVTLGVGLALLLKHPWLRFKGVFRVLLIIPWAVPNYITALMWKGMFHRQFGAINAMLGALGIEPIAWFTRFSTAFAANVATNTWLGFPFMMVVALGALQSIPQELYEAAEVDGASKWQQFTRITIPSLRPAMLPAVLLGTLWTFNMFNVIYLVSGGEPGGATDVLVSEAYRWAFQRHEQYGFAAAYSVLIFGVLWAWSRFTRRLTEGA